MRTYEQRAESILKDAIKSAIYIDENAREFYAEKTMGKNIREEDLSLELFKNFKKQGISLDIHKYNDGDEEKNNLISYFIDNRDLVLLDWKLKGKQGGNKTSLILLNEIVNTKHINFCAIYTSEPENELDNILLNILSFFSGKTKEEYIQIEELIANEEFPREIIDVFNLVNLNRSNKTFVSQQINLLQQNYKLVLAQLKEITKSKDSVRAMVTASIALANTEKSDVPLNCPSHIDVNKKIIVINNTIIIVLNKDKNKANDLFNNYKNQIINDIDSFNKLLGLELHNKLFRTSAILDDPFISFSRDALLKHRKNLKQQNISYYFNSFMNEVMMEKLSLSLRDTQLSLLEDDFLENFEKENFKEPTKGDLQKMNLFYNCLKLDKKGKTLNFGDVFLVKHDEKRHKTQPKYLICITPLCDCLRPHDNIKSNFYFAEGSNISLENALKLGDTAFISFLPNNTINWSNVASDELVRKFAPVYIKPLQYKVFEGENTIDDNNEIKVHYLDKQGGVQIETLYYLGTIRQNYAQRIANHAFSYPIRVGIDFVKLLDDK